MESKGLMQGFPQELDSGLAFGIGRAGTGQFMDHLASWWRTSRGGRLQHGAEVTEGVRRPSREVVGRAGRPVGRSEAGKKHA